MTKIQAVVAYDWGQREWWTLMRNKGSFRHNRNVLYFDSGGGDAIEVCDFKNPSHF